MKLLLSTLFLVLLASSGTTAQDAAKQISAETVELEKQLNTLKLSSDLKQRCSADIAQARASLKNGNAHLAVYTVRPCRIELATQAFVVSKADLQTAAFEQEWRQAGNQLAEKWNSLAKPPAKPLPALLVALVQISLSQSKSSYQLSHQLLNSNFPEAMRSLGTAHANVEFAVFCNGLRLPTPKTMLTFKSVGPALTKLETAAARTYKSAKPTALPAEAVSLKSNLELATALNDSSMFEGALLEYLESELQFGLILTTAENEDLVHLQGRAEEISSLLTKGKTDHSIGLLFSQMADEALKAASGNQAQIKLAVVILNRVIPSYWDYVKQK
jgi:hypothetical protein